MNSYNMENDQADERKKLPPKIEKSKSDSQGSHHTADRKLSAEEIESFGTLSQLQLRQQQRREAYSNKLSEIFKRIHKSTPCSTFTFDNSNHKEKKEQTKLGISGPQYTFDNYDDDTVVAEDLESVNQNDQSQLSSFSVESRPKYILDSNDFYQDEEEIQVDNNTVSAVGKVPAVQSFPVIMPVHGEDGMSRRNRSICQTPSSTWQQQQETVLDTTPGAVAIGSDSHESFRSNTGPNINYRRGEQRLQTAEGRPVGGNINARRRYEEQQEQILETMSSGSESSEQRNSINTLEVVAFAVDETTTRTSRDIRQDIINEAVAATEVEPCNERQDKYLRNAASCCLAILLIATIIGLSISLTQDKGANDTMLVPSEILSSDP